METATLKSDLVRRRTEHLQALEELERDIQTIEAIEKKYHLNGYKKDIHSAEGKKVETPTGNEPATYPIDGSWPDRFLFIIQKLVHATSDEVGKKLYEYQPELGPEKAHKNAQLYLSALYKKGQLKARKVDGLYVYSI